MAVTKDRESIGTNLPSARLQKFLDALDAQTCVPVPGSEWLFGEGSGAKFVFEEATYEVEELFEDVVFVSLFSAGPALVRTITDELEAELSKAEGARDYDLAKVINERIKELKDLDHHAAG